MYMLGSQPDSLYSQVTHSPHTSLTTWYLGLCHSKITCDRPLAPFTPNGPIVKLQMPKDYFATVQLCCQVCSWLCRAVCSCTKWHQIVTYFQFYICFLLFLSVCIFVWQLCFSLLCLPLKQPFFPFRFLYLICASGSQTIKIVQLYLHEKSVNLGCCYKYSILI